MISVSINANTNTSLGEITKTIEVNHGQFLEFHIYLTSALSKKDFRAVGLQYALQLLKNNDNKDAITGLKVYYMQYTCLSNKFTLEFSSVIIDLIISVMMSIIDNSNILAF